MSDAVLVNEITNAIGAHGMWKMRLRTAILTGQSSVSSATACCDDKCDFGKWIHGSSVDSATKAGIPYQVVKRLHAEFHRSAGNVLAQVERGNLPAAQELMAADYAERSDKLVRALTKWKNELLVSASRQPIRRAA